MTLAEPPTLPGSADSSEAGLLILLRRASAMIDSMWHAALADSGTSPAVQLAEASQGVHRALIALGTLERASFGSTS